MIYKAGNQNEMQHLYRSIGDTVTQVDRVQFLNVIHTSAMRICWQRFLMTWIYSEVKGTLAGHDVIIIISADEIEAEMISLLSI